MTDPSEYELGAWKSVQRFHARPFSRMLDGANEQMVGAAIAMGKQASRYLEGHPKAQSAVAPGQHVAAKGTSFVSSGARKVTDAVPDGVAD